MDLFDFMYNPATLPSRCLSYGHVTKSFLFSITTKPDPTITSLHFIEL